MVDKISIHNFEKQYNSAMKRVEQLGISQKNKSIVIKFRDYCLLNSMSQARIVKYLDFFVFLLKHFKKDLDKVKKRDVEKIVAVINAKKTFSPATKHDRKVMLKRFYKWLYGNDEDYPVEVKWIKSRIKSTEKKLPGEGELITQSNVEKLLEVVDTPRDKAFVSVLFESGCRIGEIGSMTIGSVCFDEYGTVIIVSGKTGPRRIRLVNSTPFLMTWLNAHPFNDKNKPLWVNLGVRNKHKAMEYRAFAIMLKRLFEKARIDKRCNPHLFRHSRATYLANHLTEFQMNQYFGWVQGSDMPATYVHLSGREVENTILEISGLKSKDIDKKEQPQSKKCPRCDTINNVNSTYCCKCAYLLDEKKAIELETKQREDEQMTKVSKELISKLLQKPEVMQVILEEMQKLSSKT